MSPRMRLVAEDLAGKKKGAPAVLTSKEKTLLRKYSKKVKVGAVEIGVLFGGSSSIITKFLPSGVTLAAIDPFIRDKRVKAQGSLSCARYFVEKYGDIRKIAFVKDYSHRVVRKWQKPIDFLFIDGDHDYDKVKADFDGWSPFLVKGGFLLLHDSNKPYLDNDRTFLKGFDGPTRVCQEVKEGRREFELLESVDSMNVFQMVKTGGRNRTDVRKKSRRAKKKSRLVAA